MRPMSTGSLKSHKPTIFLDRCIPPKFADGLRKFGVIVHTMSDVYGPRAEKVGDPEWITMVGEQSWIAFTQNPAIWKMDEERQALRKSGARLFCLASAQHDFDTKGLVFGRWWLSIMRRSRRAQPCFWRVDPQNNRKDLS